MSKEYDTFVNSLDELPDGEECRIVVRDLAPGRHKYNSIYVRALVSSSTEKVPEADTLWVRSELGRLYPQPWKIKVIEQLDYL